MFHPCPKCNRPLKQQGRVQFKGREYRFYLCDECLTIWKHDGIEEEVAYGFGVDEYGRVIDLRGPRN